MGLDSYLELFVTSYGWWISNIVFGVLVDTGIVFIPVIVTIASVMLQAHEDADGGGVMWAVRKLEVEVITSLFVISMALVPFSLSSIDQATLAFQPTPTITNPTPAPVTATSTATTYDAAFTGASTATVPVPLWWYAVMAVSSGVNNAVRAGVANSASGIREAEQLARLATIESPALRAEAQRFRSECWVPVHSQFHSPQASTTGVAASVASNPIYGKEDTEWIGSKTFLTDPNYYAAYRARDVVAGFAMDPVDDMDARPADVGSRPNCLRWWTDAANGLRTRLIAQGGSTLANAVNSACRYISVGFVANAVGADCMWTQDKLLQQALFKTQANFVNVDQVLGGQNTSRHSLPAALSIFGIGYKSLEASFSYQPIINFLILAQPLVLMAMYMFMPLAVVFSRYSLNFMIYGAIAIFTVKFWMAMWSIADVIDTRLVKAMYPDSSNLVQEFFANGFDGGGKRMILNALTLGLFLAFPLIWSGMMAWLGFRVGNAITASLSAAYGGGASAGAKATDLTTSAARRLR